MRHVSQVPRATPGREEAARAQVALEGLAKVLADYLGAPMQGARNPENAVDHYRAGDKVGFPSLFKTIRRRRFRKKPD
jgi:hypothetical protein